MAGSNLQTLMTTSLVNNIEKEKKISPFPHSYIIPHHPSLDTFAFVKNKPFMFILYNNLDF